MIKIFLSRCILFYQFLLYQLVAVLIFPFSSIQTQGETSTARRVALPAQDALPLSKQVAVYLGISSPVQRLHQCLPPLPASNTLPRAVMTASAPQPSPPLRGLPGEEDAWEGNREGQTLGGEVAWGEKRGSRLGWGLPPFPTLPRHLPRQRSAAMAGLPAAAAPGTGAAPPFQHPPRGTAPRPAPPTARVGPGGGVGEERVRSRLCLFRDRSGPIVYRKALVKCILRSEFVRFRLRGGGG